MDQRSSSAILGIMQRIAVVDGDLAPEEENLLQSLSDRYSLQPQTSLPADPIPQGSDPAATIGSLAAMVAPEHRSLLMKAAFMVAGITRGKREDAYICPGEEAALAELSQALELSSEAVTAAREEALEELSHQPSLWQILYGCFGTHSPLPLFH
ncbi:MAG: hypothetical protein VKK62_09260 [Synechococcaceae cyanobacterium]|nr:hypothetical protein [Synechococcaceae cyanobacterium]